MNQQRSTRKYLPVPLIILLLGGWLSWAQATKSSQKAAETPPAQPAAQTASSPGERAFRENCGRCHNPPEQLSPRITGTVLRHMRVRALLSPQDERDILKYLAP
jgi:cytochrome c553